MRDSGLWPWRRPRWPAPSWQPASAGFRRSWCTTKRDSWSRRKTLRASPRRFPLCLPTGTWPLRWAKPGVSGHNNCSVGNGASTPMPRFTKNSRGRLFMLTLQSRFRLNDAEVTAQVLDGEAIMINLSTGVYYSMDKVGGFLWAIITGGQSLAEAAAAVSARYDVLAEQAQTDVTDRKSTRLN